MKEFIIRQIANGWILISNDKNEWYYPSLDLCIAQLQQYAGPKQKVEVGFRRGGAQIDVEEYIGATKKE